MDTSAGSRTEVFSPVFLKAGVPLAIAALAAFVYARIGARKETSVVPKDSPVLQDHVRSDEMKQEEEEGCDEDEFESVESTACQDQDEEKHDDQVNEAYRNAISGIGERMKETESKEKELEARFLRYQSMKDYESLLVVLKQMLQLDIARGECLEMEVSSLEAEAKRVADLTEYGDNLLRHVRNLEQENGVLKMKVKKLARTSKVQNRVIREQRFRIEDSEAMIMRCRHELEKGVEVAGKMAEEISDLQALMDELRRDKTELTEKLETAEAALTSKEEIITIDGNEHLITELEALRKDFSAEVNELVFLRWMNACLTRQLAQFRNRKGLNLNGIDNPLALEAQESGEHALLELDLHHELDRMASEHDTNSSPGVMTEKEKKKMVLMKKFKKWVEGGGHHQSSKMSLKASKNDIKCFGRHFASEWVVKHVHERKSSASA